MLGVLTACILALSSLASQGQKKAPVLVQDKGKFTIQLDGQTVGHEDFEISPSSGGWSAQGTTDLKAPDSPATRVTGTLTLQPDGAPISYEWTSQAEKTNGAHIVFANGVAKITLQMQGARPFEQDLTFGTPLIAVLDNNLYYQYGVLARVYDWSKRGAQNLPGNWESNRFNLPEALCEQLPKIGEHHTHVVMHNDAVVQGLSEAAFQTDVEHWGVLTIGTGFGNARFTTRATDSSR